jgi:hypothetical protein
MIQPCPPTKPKYMIHPHPPPNTPSMYQSYSCTKYWETLRLHLLENAQKISNFSLFFTETRSQEKLPCSSILSISKNCNSLHCNKIRRYLKKKTKYQDICKYTASTIAACHLQREENRWQVLFGTRSRRLWLPAQAHCTALCCTVMQSWRASAKYNCKVEEPEEPAF